MRKILLISALLVSPAYAKELRVIDGDTFVYLGETIRIADIDTPELNRFDCEREKLMGREARGALKALLATGKIKLARREKKDQYGRTVAFVTVDRRDIGRKLVQIGLAQPWPGGRGPKPDWCP